jgi:transposase
LFVINMIQQQTFLLLISPEHHELQQKYQALVLESMLHKEQLRISHEEKQQVLSQITPLKNVVEQLSQKVEQQFAQTQLLQKALEEKNKTIEQLLLIKHQYDQLVRLVYARSTEKSLQTIPGQLQFEMEAEVVAACNINDGQKIESYTKHKAERKKHPGRNEIPGHIERKYIDMHPEKLPEGAELFDKIETEQLEYDPAKIFASVYRRFKYKLTKPDGSTEFFIAPLPAEKDKSIAAPSLRAHFVTEKYMYHMPLYRQVQKLAQHGIVISDSTIGDLVNRDAHSLTALYDEHRKAIVKPACGYMMADETTMTVLDSDRGKGKKSHIGYMWAYCNPVDRLVFFEYQKGRGSKHARPVLGNYKGYLHTDGYNVCAT